MQRSRLLSREKWSICAHTNKVFTLLGLLLGYGPPEADYCAQIIIPTKT